MRHLVTQKTQGRDASQTLQAQQKGKSHNVYIRHIAAIRYIRKTNKELEVLNNLSVVSLRSRHPHTPRPLVPSNYNGDSHFTLK